MFFLIANIVAAACFALCIKWVENRGTEDIVTVGMINYIVALAVSIFEFQQTELAARAGSAVWLGATNGACYFIAFFFCVYAVKYIGVSNATVISILAILAPVLCGILIWNERPGAIQVAGIALALVSLSLIGRKGDAVNRGTVPDKPWFTPWIILIFFLLCGLSRLAQEAFKHMSEPEELPLYLTTAFTVAAIPSVATLIWRQKRISASEIWMGTLMGLANIFQIYFILAALGRFAGYIVFPVASAGSLMLVTLVATGLMGERLGRLSWIGIGIASVALVLLRGWSG